MAFNLPNPGAAFNAMFQSMRMPEFLELARATQARRYSLEPHFTRNALQRKAEELEAMELENQMRRRAMSSWGGRGPAAPAPGLVSRESKPGMMTAVPYFPMSANMARNAPGSEGDNHVWPPAMRR